MNYKNLRFSEKTMKIGVMIVLQNFKKPIENCELWLILFCEKCDCSVSEKSLHCKENFTSPLKAILPFIEYLNNIFIFKQFMNVVKKIL